MTDGERKIVALLEQLLRSVRRIELAVAGERPKPAPPSAADLATLRAHRVLRQRQHEDSNFPSSTTTPEKFWRPER
jgi:hypothetical protein